MYNVFLNTLGVVNFNSAGVVKIAVVGLAPDKNYLAIIFNENINILSNLRTNKLVL
jgi:hypothetical protein